MVSEEQVEQLKQEIERTPRVDYEEADGFTITFNPRNAKSRTIEFAGVDRVTESRMEDILDSIRSKRDE